MVGTRVQPCAENTGNGYERAVFRVIKDNKGYGFIFALLFIPAALAIFSLTLDIGRFYAVKIGARHALNLALRSASAQLDMNALRDPQNARVVILQTEAQNAFYQVLRQNLRLDANNNPLPGSLVDGQVRVQNFMVVNNVPFSYQFSYEGKLYQETITVPSVTAIISFPVKVWWMSAVRPETQGTVTMYVHSTVAPRVVKSVL